MILAPVAPFFQWIRKPRASGDDPDVLITLFSLVR